MTVKFSGSLRTSWWGFEWDFNGVFPHFSELQLENTPLESIRLVTAVAVNYCIY